MAEAGEIDEDDCAYCGAKAWFQDPRWQAIEGDEAEGWAEETGTCPRCGATGLTTEKEGLTHD